MLLSVLPMFSSKSFIDSSLTFRSLIHSEGDQPWDFFGKNDAKAETAVL